MLYHILKIIVRIAAALYFRRIERLGFDNIPKSGPVLIACNHPTAFFEPILLAVLMKRPLHFLVRSDIFVKRWLWFFKATHQIPIHRFKDGFSKLRLNADSFEACYQAMSEGKVIVVFAEGSTEYEFRLRELRKGLARIALNSIKRYPKLDPQVMFAGFNYEDASGFRKRVHISLSESFSAREFYDEFVIRPNVAFIQLTDKLERWGKPHVLHINEAWMVDRGYLATRVRLANRDLNFENLKQSSEQINKLDSESREEMKQVTENLRGILDRGGWNEEEMPPVWKPDALVSILVAPLVGITILLWGFPALLARKVAMTKVKHLEFLGPVQFGLWIILSLLWIPLVLCVLWFCSPGWPFFIILLVSLSGFYLYDFLWDQWNKWLALFTSIRKREEIHRELKKLL